MRTLCSHRDGLCLHPMEFWKLCLTVMFDGLCYRWEWFSSFAKYRMFFAALISLSCLVLHTGHSHWRILSDHGFMWYWSWLLYMYPQQEHLLLDGLHFPIAITVRPCHADLYWMVVRSVPNAASVNAKLNRLFFFHSWNIQCFHRDNRVVCNNLLTDNMVP